MAPGRRSACSAPMLPLGQVHWTLVELAVGVRPVAIDVVKERLGMVLAIELAAPVWRFAGEVQDAIAGRESDGLHPVARAQIERPDLRAVEPEADGKSNLTGRPLHVRIDDRAAPVDAQVRERGIKLETGEGLGNRLKQIEQRVHERIGVETWSSGRGACGGRLAAQQRSLDRVLMSH